MLPIYSIRPFTRISHLVSKSYCVFDIPVKGCKTSDNVTVTIDCSVVFRIMGDEKKGENPELVRTFVHQVTPNGLEDQLKDAMAEEIRTLARSLKHTWVFTCRRGAPPVNAEPAGSGGGGGGGAAAAAEAKVVNEKGDKGDGGADTGDGVEMVGAARELYDDELEDYLGEDVTRNMEARLNAQFEPQGVQIHDIMIQNIKLPEDIMEQMSSKTMVRSKQDYEVMEQTFEMQSIRLKNEKAKLKLDHKEAQDLAKVEGGRNIQAARDQLQERKTERNKYLEDFKEHTDVEVSKVRAGMVEETTRLEFEYLQVKQTLKLQSEEEAARVVAETEAQIAELEAESKLKIAALQGEAKTTLAAAELSANQYLAKSREFELREKQLGVYQALASNKDVVLSHTDTPDFNMLLLGECWTGILKWGAENMTVCLWLRA
jgi:regulator of protease activity HflC (stomatin/prohibitin superfamily)